MTNEEIINLAKSIVDTTTGGLVGTKQMTEFITSLIDRSAFLKNCRRELGIKKDLDLDHLGIEQMILRKKIENEAPENETGKLIRTVNKLTPVNIIAYIKITYKWMQKALGGDINDMGEARTILSGQINDLLLKQISNDLLNLFFNGDTDSENPFYSILDGWSKKLKDEDSGAHVIPYPNGTSITDVLDLMYDTMPDDFMTDPAALRFFCHPKTRRQYKKEIAKRDTTLGDLYLIKNEPVYYEDILVDPCWAIPQGEIHFTLPENYAIGYGQDMLVERDRNIKAQNIDIVTTLDADCNVVISDGVVIAYKEANGAGAGDNPPAADKLGKKTDEPKTTDPNNEGPKE